MINKTNLYTSKQNYIINTGGEMKTPHVCPVCGGNGLVLNGFYDQYGGNWPTSSATPEMCRTCNGKGIVWEPETNIEIDYTQEEK